MAAIHSKEESNMGTPVPENLVANAVATPVKILPQNPLDARLHRSTTHVEIFFHIRAPRVLGREGTVFFRLETSTGEWKASAAVKYPKDSFSRRYGRSKARRTYFQAIQDLKLGKTGVLAPLVYPLAPSNYPTYEDAEKVFKSWITKNYSHIAENPRAGLKMSDHRAD
jgi:hypothetical protein